MTDNTTDDDLIFENLKKRKQYEAGEIPDQLQFVKVSPATPEGERTGTPGGDTPRRAAGTLAALLIQTTGDDEI